MSIEKLDSREIGIQNRRNIYKYLRLHQDVSKQELVKELGLSLPTVTQNLNYFLDAGLVEQRGFIKGTGGRNAAKFRFIPEARAAIGIDLTRHFIKAVAVNLVGHVVILLHKEINFNLEGDNYLRAIGEMVDEVQAKLAMPKEQILGVGISIAGIVSEDGEYVSYGKTLGFTGETRARLAKYISLPSYLIHDSYAAGFAESFANPDFPSMFCFALNNSVGGNLLLAHKIYSGCTQHAADIPHMIVVPENGKRCYCGNYGCFDTVCNAQVLEACGGDLDGFFALVRQGDARATACWDTYLNYLSLGIQNIRILFDVPIVLSGQLNAYLAPYMDDLYRRVDARYPFQASSRDILRQGSYCDEACAVGAACIYIQKIVDDLT